MMQNLQDFAIGIWSGKIKYSQIFRFRTVASIQCKPIQWEIQKDSGY